MLALFVSFSPLLMAGAQSKPSDDDILSIVPADSLFCFRISGFDDSLTLLGKYVGSPAPLPLQLFARAPLAQLLGDPQLKNVNTNGVFAVFAVARGKKDAPLTPANIYLAALIPVTDYTKFVTDNQTCAKPDDNGISKTQPASGGKAILIKQVNSFALIAGADNYDRFAALAKSISRPKAKKLSAVIRGQQAKAAAKAPFWAYGNVHLAGEIFTPLISAQIDKMKAEIKKMNPQDAASPADFMDFYTKMFEVMFNQLDHVTLTLKPTPDLALLSINVSPVKDTTFASMLVPSKTPRKPNPLLPYLEDGAMINVAGSIDKPSTKKLYDSIYDCLLPALTQNAISAETIEKLRKLTVDEVDSFGDFVAFSMSADTKSKPPFEMTYVIEVADAAKLQTVLEESMKLMNAGVINDMYKSMGLDVSFHIHQATAEYKGVSIDSAHMAFTAKDAESEMGKAIAAIYGSGFDYRWALTDGLGLYAIGSDADRHIKELIDQAKSDQAKPVASEMTQALALLPAARNADAVGTINYVRMLKMAMETAKTMMPKDAPIPQIDTPTESNIVFSAKTLKNSLRIDIAVPKKHLTEIQTAFAQLAAQAKKQPPAPKAEEVRKDIVAPDAKVEKVADGFAFTEGPASDGEGNVYFSDIPNNKIHMLSLDGKVTVFQDNTGGANGLYFDNKGNLVACAGGDRLIRCYSPDGEKTLAKQYDGKKLNSPNDLWIDPKGGIYFTDPRYGRTKDDMEQPGEHVYYILPGDGPDRKVIRVTDDLVRPNGIIGTNDGKTLYIADHGASKTWSYTMNPDGTLAHKQLFAEEGSDGMTIDSNSNIYLTNTAVKVYCCKGNKIATIDVPESPANVTFGGPQKKTLFVTARTSLYSIRTNVSGL
jgi:gluconolactonase